jgi:hypothetical protein
VIARRAARGSFVVARSVVVEPGGFEWSSGDVALLV